MSEPIRVAIAGLGQLGGDLAKALVNLPAVSLVAAADPREAARSTFEEVYGGRAHATIEELGADPGIDAVFIATPSSLHCQNVVSLAGAGKHMVLTKPMALTLDECHRMVRACDDSGVALIYGTGGMPFRPGLLAMREIIESGRLGRLRSITHWAFSDWMLRPRMVHEVTTDGGLLLNQGPHVIDTIRLLGGGMVKSVRGTTVDMGLEGRPCPGYLTGMLEFEEGTPATFIYNGYGYLFGWEFAPWADHASKLQALESSYDFRRALRAGNVNDASVKEGSRFGAQSSRADFRSERGQGVVANEGWLPSDDGLVIAHCERGAIRQSAGGLYVYDDAGRREVLVDTVFGASAEANEVQELCDAIAGRRSFRDGRWGRATLEVVLALATSGQEHREIEMKYQVPVPDGLWKGERP